MSFVTRLKIVTLLTSLATVASMVSPSNAQLVAHWRLNDGTGGATVTGADDAIDAGLTFQDATVEGTGGTWINDPIRGDVFSTGENDRLVLGTQGIDRNVGFTWTVWGNIASSNLTDSGADVIIGTRTGNPWNKVDMGGVSNWAGISYTGSQVADDTWHQFTYLGDSTSVRFYIDGVLIGSDATTSSSTLNSKFELGGSSQFSEDVTGLLSDVGVWQEALTGEEVVGLFDVTNAANLGYDAGQFDLLKQVHDSGTGYVDIDGLRWSYATSLVGGAGLSGSGTDYTLILGAGGTGLLGALPPAPLTPEPGTLQLTLITLFGFAGWYCWRRRNAQTKCSV